METTVGRVLGVLMAAVAATGTALGYIAHHDLGLSHEGIRTSAVSVAALIVMLMVIEFFGKKLRKPK